MRVLLDTNIVLFLLMRDRRLKATTLEFLDAHASERHVSIVTLWEVATKASMGRLDVHPRVVASLLEPTRLSLLPLEVAHVLALVELPQHLHHRDPFDRILLAQARAEGMSFMISDAHLAAYGVPIIPA